MTKPSRSAASRLAGLHAQAFDAPWDERAFDSLLDHAGVLLVEETEGFILLRAVADEAEILTLAVRPAARRRGVGRGLLDRGLAAAAAEGASRVFLEVAEGNAPARALYAAAGFAEVGRRPRYYARSDGSREDALLFALNLPATLP